MKKSVLVMFVASVCLIFCISIFTFIVNYDIKKIKLYNELELYKGDNYLYLNDDKEYCFAANKANLYFPDYSNFPFEDNVDKFYIFDGSKTLGRTSISFVLEIKFENNNDYNEYVCYELDRCSYTDSFDVNYEKYECLVTTNNEFTKYYSKDDRPYCFGMFCMNKDELIIRYVYFENVGVAVDEKFLSVQKYSNCEW